jgi:cobalt-precorrin 5A hydrolase
MRIEIVCFTDRGQALGGEFAQGLSAEGDDARLERCGGGGVRVGEWAAERFCAADALVFIGAAGIAVRAVAPLVASKACDPAVVVVDDCGRFAVSLLSGHLGGANELAARLARLIGATPVITTATDGTGTFAVDVWAKQAGLFVANPERIKHVSSRLLSGRAVRLRSAFPVDGELPDGVERADGGAADIVVDIAQAPEPTALWLVPPAVVLGVGCRKGTSAETVEKAVRMFCEKTGIPPQAFGAVCSIDLKKDELGLIAFCAARSLPFTTFSAGTLARAEGVFSASGFVESVTGVDNVCERAAVVGSCGGALLAGKTALDGVTMAAAVREYRLPFAGGDGETA